VNPRLKQNTPKKSALPSLKIPPHAAGPGLPIASPSILHFTQLKTGGYQIISLMIGALP